MTRRARDADGWGKGQNMLVKIHEQMIGGTGSCDGCSADGGGCSKSRAGVIAEHQNVRISVVDVPQSHRKFIVGKVQACFYHYMPSKREVMGVPSCYKKGVAINAVAMVIVGEEADTEVDGVMKREELKIDDVLEQEVLGEKVAQGTLKLSGGGEIGGIIGKTDGELAGFFLDEEQAGGPGGDKVAVFCLSDAVLFSLGLEVSG
jgi:hypothetical protein